MVLWRASRVYISREPLISHMQTMSKRGETPRAHSALADQHEPSGQCAVNHRFNASCFAVPTPGTFGNSGINVLEGPGRDQHDFTLSKTFQIRERPKFTFGAAATNLLNHPNFWNRSANILVPGSVGVVNLSNTLRLERLCCAAAWNSNW